MSDQFEIRWLDRGHPPRIKPDPAFPDGVPVVDASMGAAITCVAELPYPTGEVNVGTWLVDCKLCRLRVGVTAASRPDDPRSVKLACKIIPA
jgi:hypothetical protein